MNFHFVEVVLLWCSSETFHELLPNNELFFGLDLLFNFPIVLNLSFELARDILPLVNFILQFCLQSSSM